MRVENVEVLIIGGGGAGLTTTNLLSQLGVSSLLVERHAGTSHLPKAHYLNQRVMEINKQIGTADALYAAGAPAENMDQIVWQTSLGGTGPLDGKVIFSADAMGGGRFAADHAQKGAARAVNIGQIQIEPILRTHAEKVNPGNVRFRTEFLDFKEVDGGLEATIRDLQTGEHYQVNAKYIVAADRGQSVGPKVGVKMVGPTDIADYVGVYFRADLSKFIHDDTSVMRVILPTDQQPNKPVVGGLLAFGPKHWDRHSEEWAIGWGFAADDPMRNDESNMEQRIQEFLKVDAPIDIIHITHWKMEGVVAERWRFGRAFVVGDAAHRHTPGGGLGMSSGMQDVHNLCWKLLYVLRGHAGDSLLDSYEPERKPAVSRNAENSLLAFDNHSIFVSAMGLTPGAPQAQNEAALTKLFTDSSEGKARRTRLKVVFESLMGEEYAPHDLEMGYQYDSGAVVQDGTPYPERDPLGSHYIQTSHPGCRLPHVWLHKDGNRVSTHDLLPIGGFLVLTGADGGNWVAAAQSLAAERNIPIVSYTISATGDASDPSGAWAKESEISESGVLLVRPDGHVGYRAHGSVGDTKAALARALDTILAIVR